ncbi:MAG TPA: thermonuclease family protein [Solirubrobacteraceae bacterium]|nr:thermonuclease family protein [Solirubrobacteraceae bacterium]
MPRLLIALAFAVAAAVLALDDGGALLDRLEDTLAGASGGERTARVERVVDGDTLKLAGGDRVRLIGVDTPETKKPGTPVQCFGKAASAFTERLVEGRRVTLAFDAEREDRYGRLLAYITRASDGLDVNAELVRRGYARTLTIQPNDRHADEYAALARTARRHGRGLWAACR